ncbi:RHS repeat-associated core domain-containing protein [Flavobacterium branchiophilum]|uniref:RHS repeat-associated protein n=1 Tax=Flavobacterium branchiophilum TaxID=55197 RepID=A0A2H3K958_9FLAO|nr:RHS repeat-associated core domain-containing protein [Flavobacterium branchiophilum]PDS22572.1 hypothetical protein B0A77_13070 [Flavobacterium branchiophilum]
MRIKLIILITLISNLLFSQSFHDTQGKLEISNSGQATFTLPVAMPPSIKDVGPIINLVYVSGQNGGIAGQGWNISNISSISRMSTRQDIDGYRDGVDFDADDKLSLDGQRLLVKTGNYWLDGSTYETEVQSNTKVELKDNGTGIYFIVTAPDGSRSWYGNYGGNNASDATAFYITRFEDANGNFMTYHYNKPLLKNLCISEIRFSANVLTNPNPLNKIVFTYKNAARREFAYIKGIKIEKAELLQKIEVYTNDLLFKKYEITQTTPDAQGYERVAKIQEFNGAGEPANPILFEYKNTVDYIYENTTSYTDALNISTSPEMSGDFDGDNRLDFITGNKLYTKLFNDSGATFNLPNLGSTRQKFTATTLFNNKVNQKQSIVHAKENLNSVDFKIYNLENNGLINTYTKTISMDNSGSCSDECTVFNYDLNGNIIIGPGQPVSKCSSPTFIKDTNKYIEGDFNGDSISDVLILSYVQYQVYTPALNDGNDPIDIGMAKTTNQKGNNSVCKMESFTSEYISEARMVDLNANSPTTENSSGNFTINNTGIQLLQKGQRYVMDFNSDGKADILMIENNRNYKIISFKQLANAPWAELEVIGQGVLDSYSPSKQILFGDFNGDGKPDVTLPRADGNGCEGCTEWDIYYSNPNQSGNNFFVKETYNIVEYRPSSGDDYETQWHSSNYYAMDVNKDGKSDIVRVWTNLWQYSWFWDPKDIDSSWRVSTYINNIGLNGGFTNNYSSPSSHDNNDNSRPIPLVSNYKYKGLDSDLLMIRNHVGNSFDKTVTFLDFKKDFSEDNLLRKVIQSNGAIVDEIAYDSMVSNGMNNGLGTLDGFYSSSESLEYPLIELKQMVNNKLVRQVQNTSLNVVKKQDFMYHGLAVNLKGIGIIGFKKTARSSWYRTTNDKKNWNIIEINASKRGAVEKTYTLLLNGFIPFNFGTNYSSIINKTENIYTENIDSITKKYSILLNTQTNTDYLTNIVSQKIYDYYSNDYFLPLSVTENKYLGSTLNGSTNTITSYYNNANGIGSNYYIGKPKEVNIKNTTYVNTVNGLPDIKTKNEKYFYNNSNLISVEKKSNNSTETLIENFVYLPNGLLQSKTISAIGTTSNNAVSSRTTSYTYDVTNRFVKTTTDIEGLVTINLTYHPLYGTVLSQQNPYLQVSTSVYDNWGKRVKFTDFLNKSINYIYTRTGNIYKTLQVGDDGSSSMVESDALARQIRKGVLDLNGNWTYVSKEYDFLGRKVKESDPYFSSNTPSLWTLFEYDDYNRPIKTTSPSGKVIDTFYNGLYISATDSAMTKSKTMNANGQVISATDTPGGTINYKFDANNNLVESDYQGIKITIQYDNWDRKVKLFDSSAGNYTTFYNAFGEVKTETTPKGTTSYNLDPVGKVLTKTIIGDGTSITSSYTYDPVNKWLTNIAVTNPNDGNSNYAYSYDLTTKQLNKTIETLYTNGSTIPFATFTKQLTFDAFGRVSNEISTAFSHGRTSSKTITHTYKNGTEWQLLDGTNVKWQANSVNARGQLTSQVLGNGISISNTFDNFGYNIENKHVLGANNIMTLNNVFDPILANLTSRSNSLFDVKENFVYDNQDRLTSWDGLGQNLLTFPFNSTTDGFVFNGSSTVGSVSNLSGMLKVSLKNTFVSANKSLNLNVATGNKLRIKADVSNKTGSNGVIVNAVMIETDPLDPLNYAEIFIGTINNGVFDNNYTVSDFVQNPKLTLRFIIDEGSPSTSNGLSASNTDLNGNLIALPPIATFNVDNLKIDNVSSNYQSYDDRGRIIENEIGQYKYTINNKPYQNSSIFTSSKANTYYSSKPLQNISYNAFKAPIQIEEQGVEKLSFGYNAMLQRSIMYYGNNDTDKLKRPFRKYYSADGSMEIKAIFAPGNSTNPTSVEMITYVGGDAYTAPILIKSDGTAQSYYYLHRDYQGSIMAITNAVGAVVEKRLYNPWGEIVKIQDGIGNNLTKLTFFDRGYTGHEHLEGVGLIHMNGRLYDAKLHRFLQPDNFVQDPYNTQSFNRYGYCWNNPLKYTDKNGEELVSAILIGAGIALAAYLTTNLINDQPITLKGALMATFVGAVSGAVTFGIGSWTQSITNFTLKATTQALSHGLFQGTLSGVQGGGFWSGFASGTLSSIASSAFSGGMDTKVINGKRYNVAGSGWSGAGKFAKSTFGMISFGTVMGGAGAELTGGNFWKGAVTGLVVSGLNHAMSHNTKSKTEGTLFKDQQTLEGTALNDTFEASMTVDYEYIVTNKGEVQVLENSIQVGEPVMNDILNPFDQYKPNYNLSKQINPLVQLTPNSKSIIVIRAYLTHIGIGAGIIPQAPIGFFQKGFEFLGQVNAANPSLSSMSVKAASEYRLYN